MSVCWSCGVEDIANIDGVWRYFKLADEGASFRVWIFEFETVAVALIVEDGSEVLFVEWMEVVCFVVVGDVGMLSSLVEEGGRFSDG